MSKIPVYEIELTIGYTLVTLLTKEKPNTYHYDWQEDDVEPVGYLEVEE